VKAGGTGLAAAAGCVPQLAGRAVLDGAG